MGIVQATASVSSAITRDMLAEHPYLVADVGGTKIELGRAARDGSSILAVRQLAVADFPTIEAAVESYLSDQTEAWPEAIALAIAGPVLGDEVALTNGPWRFSIRGTQRALRLDRLLVLNDFTALALGLPTLLAEHRMSLGGGAGDAEAPIGLIGPGTGLGVSGLVRIGARWLPLAGEGGHASLAPEDEEEAKVLAQLRRKFGHVSAERVLSGPGLVNLFQALCAIEGMPEPSCTPESIAEWALADSRPLARSALAMFCSLLGSAAGNLALMLGARGGVFIGGGVCPRFPDFLAASACRARFEAKGRMRAYLEPVPLWLIRAPHPALHGAAAALCAPQ